MPVTVAAVSGELFFVCTGVPDYHFTPCNGAKWENLLGRTLTLQGEPFEAGRGAYDGLMLLVDVLRPTENARACLRYFTDVAGESHDLECADSGSLTLSAWPTAPAEIASLHATMNLHFPDGATIDAAF